MKIKTWIKYDESYIPARCRKTRYRECEDFINANLKETNLSNMQLAFEDNSYEGKGKIYFYNGKLWCKATIRDICLPDEDKYTTPLEAFIYWREHSSWFFPREWRDGEHPDRKHMLYIVKKETNKFLLVDGVLYVTTAEPRYVINTFGSGHNHGGTGMFCEYFYNSNISKENYFPATEGNAAVSYANSIAQKRGDTNDIGKFKPFIIVHMPELVKVKPNKQHNNVNQLLNDMEKIIENSDDVITAGLLCMML